MARTTKKNERARSENYRNDKCRQACKRADRYCTHVTRQETKNNILNYGITLDQIIYIVCRIKY